MVKCSYEKGNKCTLTVGTVLAFGLFIGYLFGYTHCFQAVKHNGYISKSECKWGDVAGEDITLIGEIPAKLIH